MIDLKFSSLALCLAMAAAPAFAQTDEQKAELDTLLAKVTTALEAGDMAVMLETLPPTMLENMASGSGMDKDKLIEATRAQAEAAGSAMTFSEVEVGGDDIKWEKTESGKDYALVPSKSVVEVKDPSSGAVMKMKQAATFLAFPDEGEWYMVDISSAPQKAMFVSAFPDYADVTVPETSVEMVQ